MTGAASRQQRCDYELRCQRQRDQPRVDQRQPTTIYDARTPDRPTTMTTYRKGEHDEISNLVYEAIVYSRHRWKLARFRSPLGFSCSLEDIEAGNQEDVLSRMRAKNWSPNRSAPCGRFAPSSPAWRRRRYAPQSGGSDRWRRPVPAAARQFGCRAGGAGREIIPGHRASRSHRLVGLAEKPPLLLCPKYCILGTAKTRKLQRLLYFGSAENDRKSREPYISPDSATTMPA